MSQKSVITVEDITKTALEERRTGCEKELLHEDLPVQTAVYRVQPGSGVPTHQHAWVYDLFIGVAGHLEIRYEGERGNGVFVLKPGGFCRMPPGMRHELSNPSKTEETTFCSYKRPTAISIISRRPSAPLRPRCPSRRGVKLSLRFDQRVTRRRSR